MPLVELVIIPTGLSPATSWGYSRPAWRAITIAADSALSMRVPVCQAFRARLAKRTLPGQSGTRPYFRPSHAPCRQASPGQGLQPGDKGGVPGGATRPRATPKEPHHLLVLRLRQPPAPVLDHTPLHKAARACLAAYSASNAKYRRRSASVQKTSAPRLPRWVTWCGTPANTILAILGTRSR